MGATFVNMPVARSVILTMRKTTMTNTFPILRIRSQKICHSNHW